MFVVSFQQKYSRNNNRDNHDILASQKSHTKFSISPIPNIYLDDNNEHRLA